MRVGIDTQTTLGQKTGFGFYVENLTKTLQQVAGDDQFILLSPDQEDDLSTPGRLYWDQIIVPRKAKQANVELLHQPAFSAPIFYPGKKVVTIHDVISLFYSNIPFFSRQFYSKWMPFSYRFADHFITISEHSKKDIHQKLLIPDRKITVINLAADQVYAHKPDAEKIEHIKAKYHLRRNYILNVGTINPRKNLEFLVRIFASTKKEHRLSHQLVITGKKGWHYNALFQLVKDLGLEQEVVFTGYVDDDEKLALYHGADLFVFPSIYEGFGLPPLEAMMCGTPVISSNTSSLPEVMGNGGITLSPTDESAWVKAIVYVLTNPTIARQLTEKGKQQAKRFSWERCAKETLRVYHRVLSDSE